MRKFTILAAVALGVFSIGLPAQATNVPVSNPSFEFVPPTNTSCCTWGDFPNPALYPTDSTWVASSGYAQGGYATNGVGDHFTYSPDGSGRYLYLSNVGTITQDLNITLTPGEQVSLTFYDGRDRSAASGYCCEIGGGVLAASIMVGAQTVTQNYDTTAVASDTWYKETLTTTVTTGGDLSIKFATVSATPWLDAVSVDVTPEPASLGVLGLGALAFLGSRRRRV